MQKQALAFIIWDYGNDNVGCAEFNYNKCTVGCLYDFRLLCVAQLIFQHTSLEWLSKFG